MLKRLSFGQIYLLLGVLLAASVVAAAALGYNDYTPPEMARYLAQAFGWMPVAPDHEGHEAAATLQPRPCPGPCLSATAG